MTDILDLEGWNVIAKRVDGDDYLIEAEYTVPPKACTKCGNIGNLYKHGPKPIYIRDSPIRGRPVRILANAQRFKCRECGGTFIQPLGGIHPDSRMTSRCVEFIQAQCLRQTFLHIALIVGCDDKTVRNLAGDYIDQLNQASQKKPRHQSGAGGSAGPAPVPRAESLRTKMLRAAANTCASCGGIYDATDLHLTRMGPLFADEPELNLVVMCSHCKSRFHTERANGHS